MWSRSYSQRVKGVSAEQIWNVWVDVNQWVKWQNDIEAAELKGKFEEGNTYMLRPKGGPNVKIEILKVNKHVNFTDLTKFPLAQMTGSHDFIKHGDELELKTTMTVRGPLAFFWVMVVAKGIVKDLPSQTQNLIDRARKAA